MHAPFFIGIAAGVVSALLFAASGNAGMAGLLLLTFLAPLPITIAGFGWGWLVSAIAAVVAFGVLTALASLKAGAFHLLAFGLPMAAAIYFLLLNRPTTTATGREEFEWYPVGWVVFGVAVTSGLMGLAALFTIGSSSADLEAHVAKAIDALMKADIPWPGGKTPSAEDAARLKLYLTVSFSGMIAIGWMWMALFSLWIGAKVARASGLLLRPWPNISMIALPPWAGAALAAAIAVSFLPDYPGLIGAGFATGLFLAYMLVGLAIVHNVSWRFSMRPLILLAIYVFLALFNPLSSLAIAIATLALVEPFMRLRNPYYGGLITRDPPDPSDT